MIYGIASSIRKPSIDGLSFLSLKILCMQESRSII